MITLCDYCERYEARFIVRSDDESSRVCARHLAFTIEHLSKNQETYLTTAPITYVPSD